MFAEKCNRLTKY